MSSAPPERLAFPSVPPMPAIARILACHSRESLSAFITVAIDLLDTLDGDPDLEDDDPAEEADPAEDADPVEEDNEDCCLAGDDRVFSGPAFVSNYAGFRGDAALYGSYGVGMDEDMEKETWSTFGAQSDPLHQ